MMKSDSAPIRLVVCLGNPGAEYAGTRHNAGWIVGDAILNLSGASVGKTVFQPDNGELFWFASNDGRGCLLLKPLTYMNASGEAVSLVARHFRLSPREMLVIMDDLDLPEGALRLRMQGSNGGHRGLGSIIQCLQDSAIARLRVGIGRPKPDSGTSIVDYVLAPWVAAGNAGAALEHQFQLAAKTALHAVECGVETAMQELGRRQDGRTNQCH